MGKPFLLFAGAIVMISVRAGLGQTPPAPPPGAASPSRPASTTQTPRIDCNWLAVDTTSKTATFHLIAGLTGLNGALNFNGFRDGGLTFTVPMNWNVVIQFRNHDGMLPHSAEVIDSTQPLPAAPVDPAFPRAMTVRLAQGIGPEEQDTMRFVAAKAGSYLIVCAVPGHSLTGMWIRLRVSPSDTRPKLAASAAGMGQ